MFYAETCSHPIKETSKNPTRVVSEDLFQVTRQIDNQQNSYRHKYFSFFFLPGGELGGFPITNEYNVYTIRRTTIIGRTGAIVSLFGLSDEHRATVGPPI